MKILKSLWPMAAILPLLGLGTYVMSGHLSSVENEAEYRRLEALQEEAAGADEDGEEISIENAEQGSVQRFSIPCRNSWRVRGSVLKTPRMALVRVVELCFSTPRIIMHMWCASVTTASPSGCSSPVRASAICEVMRSCSWKRRANTSTMRANLLSPRIFRLGM